MRTRTIFDAHRLAAYEYRIGSYAKPVKPSKRRRRLSRQIQAFAAELLRRMDERDAMGQQLADCKASRQEIHAAMMRWMDKAGHAAYGNDAWLSLERWWRANQNDVNAKRVTELYDSMEENIKVARIINGIPDYPKPMPYE